LRGIDLDDTTGVVNQRLTEEGFLDVDQPERIVGDLLRVACGWEDDPDKQSRGKPATGPRSARNLASPLIGTGASNSWLTQLQQP